MNLGQLYYFAQKTSVLQDYLSPQGVDKIEIYSFETGLKSDYEGLSKDKIAQIIKDKFLVSYQHKLEESNLEFASDFWKALTSPLSQSDITLEPSSDYQAELVGWLENETSIKDLGDLLSSGFLQNELNDYACFYGLLLLSTLTNIAESSEYDIKDLQNSQSKKVVYSKNPEIIVYTNPELQPIFKNFNCVVLPYSNNPEVNLEKSIYQLSGENNIKLILFTEEGSESSVSLLEKKLSDEMLIAHVGFENANESRYFDDLVKQTLGVRLTD